MKCRHCDAPWEYEWEYCPECHRNYGGARYPATQTEEELREIDERIDQIREAFSDVSLGGSQTLHQASLEGAYSDERVWLAKREKDPETHWWEVPDWKLESLSSALSFLEPEGWRFYIPAFLCWSLKNWRLDNSITPWAVLWGLANSDEYWLKCYQSLNRAQSEAVYDFLAFFDRYSGEDDARNAIQAYWHRFKKD